MKNLIIIIGTIMLGVYVFNMMLGDEDNSLKSVSRKAMDYTLEIYHSQEEEE